MTNLLVPSNTDTDSYHASGSSEVAFRCWWCSLIQPPAIWRDRTLAPQTICYHWLLSIQYHVTPAITYTEALRDTGKFFTIMENSDTISGSVILTWSLWYYLRVWVTVLVTYTIHWQQTASGKLFQVILSAKESCLRLLWRIQFRVVKTARFF